MRTIVLSILLLIAPLAQSAERILALSPHACEILFAVGAEKEVIGVADTCDYPESAQKLPSVGDFKRINVEAALRLKPTMAVVFDRHMSGLLRLESFGVKVIQSHPRTVMGVVHDILNLGRLTGHARQARVLADNFTTRLRQVRRQATEPIPVFYEAWSGPLVSSGARSFITDVLCTSGAENVFGHVAIESPRISVESVIKARPLAILVPDVPGHVKARELFWQQYFGGRVRIVPVPQDMISRPGPRLIDGIEILSARLRKVANDI